MAYYHWRAFARDVAITCAGSIAMGLLLAVAAGASTELRMIERSVEDAAGTRILWALGMTHGCKKNLLGFYEPRSNRVIMCESNLNGSLPMALEILKHESWHAIQFQCNEGRPVLRDAQLRAGMRRSDKAILRNAYPANQHRLEAEARTVSQLPTRNFLDGAMAYCR